jgi:hypothetical protein
MLYRELVEIARSLNVKIPQHCKKVQLEDILSKRGLIQGRDAESAKPARSPKALPRAPSPKAPQRASKASNRASRASPRASAVSPNTATPSPRRTPKAALPKTPGSKRSHAGEGWTLISEGRDGAAYVKGTVVRKVFTARRKAQKEAQCLQILQGTGIAPRFISYDGNLTLDMAFVQAQTLREYVAKMQDKIASDAIQTSFINVFETLRGMQVDPNDNNLGNFLVDTHAQKVYRIDFSDFKRRAAPYPFVLLSKVYKVFPRVAVAWRQHLQAEITPEWRHRLGYT